MALLLGGSRILTRRLGCGKHLGLVRRTESNDPAPSNAEPPRAEASAEGSAEKRLRLTLSIDGLKASVAKQQGLKLEERTGRLRAEAALQSALAKLQAQPADARVSDSNDLSHLDEDTAAGRRERLASQRLNYFSTFWPIATFRSVFSSKYGAPRQPLLVPAARGRLTLRHGVPAAALDGLHLYSHVWIVSVFHANSSARPLAAVRPPRLPAGAPSPGVLATRSPHRPSPIGLSVARLESVDVSAATVTVLGADLIDGTPVLDIKPYLPYADSLGFAAVPAWAAGADNPGELLTVEVGLAQRRALVGAWETLRGRALCSSADEFVALVRQVLSRDLRPARQRSLWPARRPSNTPPADACQCPAHVVVLEGVAISYEVPGDGGVRVVGAAVDASAAAELLPRRAADSGGVRPSDGAVLRELR